MFSSLSEKLNLNFSQFVRIVISSLNIICNSPANIAAEIRIWIQKDEKKANARARNLGLSIFEIFVKLNFRCTTLFGQRKIPQKKSISNFFFCPYKI